MKNNTKITNLTITKRQNPFNQDYYIIYDNDNNQAYFAFKNKLLDKTLWNDLGNKYSQVKEIWLEFEENPKGKQIINLEILESDSEFII